MEMISVLITTRNRNELFWRTLASFEEQKFRGDWEMLVVDEGDRTALLVQDLQDLSG